VAFRPIPVASLGPGNDPLNQQISFENPEMSWSPPLWALPNRKFRELSIVVSFGNESNWDMSEAKTFYKTMSSTQNREIFRSIQEVRAKAHRWYNQGNGKFERFVAHQIYQLYIVQPLFGDELQRVLSGDEALVFSGYVLVKFGALERPLPFCGIATGKDDLTGC
jgi:hypothetical protein